MGLLFSGEINKLTASPPLPPHTCMHAWSLSLSLTHTLLPRVLQTHLTSWVFFPSLLCSTLFCNSKSQTLLSEYQRWHFMYEHNLTLWQLEWKSYMQNANMKEITDVQAMEVSFDSTNTLYSAILSNSQLHFGILYLKLTIGRRKRSTVL